MTTLNLDELERLPKEIQEALDDNNTPWADVLAARLAVAMPALLTAARERDDLIESNGILRQQSVGMAEQRDALKAECERLRAALLDLLVSLIPMPPYETGKTAQDAWSNNRMNAEERARAALEQKP